jgi:steroid delta-isomerase-like uncharacterized protein
MRADVELLIDRYFAELLNGGQFETADEIVTPDFRFYGPSAPQGRTIAGLAQFVADLRVGFSDKHFEELERIVEGDRAASHFQMTGRHDGSFHGIPPSGRLTKLDCCDLFYFRDGRIAQVRAYFDFLDLLKQLGAIPGARQLA